MISWFQRKLTGLLVRYLKTSARNYEAFSISSSETLESVLQEADVIYYDRLVDPEILDLARRDAERVYVGKAPG